MWLILIGLPLTSHPSICIALYGKGWIFAIRPSPHLTASVPLLARGFAATGLGRQGGWVSRPQQTLAAKRITASRPFVLRKLSLEFGKRKGIQLQFGEPCGCPGCSMHLQASVGGGPAS